MAKSRLLQAGWWSLIAAASCLVLVAGCGRGDTVPVSGHVLIEGTPATNGWVFLNPQETGDRAFALVDVDGSFQVKSSSGSMGAAPGTYKVLFRQDIDPQTAAKLKRPLSGTLDVDQLTMSYRPAVDHSVTISPEGHKDLIIDIRQDQGWRREVSD